MKVMTVSTSINDVQSTVALMMVYTLSLLLVFYFAFASMGYSAEKNFILSNAPLSFETNQPDAFLEKNSGFNDVFNKALFRCPQ